MQEQAATAPPNLTTARNVHHFVLGRTVQLRPQYCVDVGKLQRLWNYVNGSSPMFEGWTSGSSAVALASDEQKPSMHETTMGT